MIFSVLEDIVPFGLYKGYEIQRVLWDVLYWDWALEQLDIDFQDEVTLKYSECCKKYYFYTIDNNSNIYPNEKIIGMSENNFLKTLI